MKKYKIEIHAEAKIDFYAQIEYLSGQYCTVETLHKFLDEMEEGVRKFGPTKTFRYLIFYTVLESGLIRIIDYAGPGRQPRWMERI